MVGAINSGIGGVSPFFQKDMDDNAKAAALQEASENGLTAEPVVSVQPQPSGDTVTISDEARKLAEQSREEESKEQGLQVNRTRPEEEQDAGGDRVKEIREKIEEVKKALQEAQNRLSQAQSASGDTSAKPGEDPAEAAARAAAEAISGSAEVEAIQAEIKMLNQELLMLNDQLREAMKGKGGAQQGATGTAGLGGAGGRGGLGERMPINP